MKIDPELCKLQLHEPVGKSAGSNISGWSLVGASEDANTVFIGAETGNE